MSSQCVCRLISHASDPWRAEFHLSLCKGSRSWSVPLASCPHVRSSSVDYNQCQSSPSLPTLLLWHAAPDSLHLTPTWSSVTFHISICRSTSHLGSFQSAVMQSGPAVNVKKVTKQYISAILCELPWNSWDIVLAVTFLGTPGFGILKKTNKFNKNRQNTRII